MKKTTDPGRRLLTRAEVAHIFQVSPSTVTRWAEAGKLPAVKTLGGHRRYEAKAVMDLAQRLLDEEVRMEKTVIEAPAMYGDHHVVEVRRILLEMPGVEEVNASSCFQAVEVLYDPAQVSAADIEARLDEAGYLGPLTVPVETGLPASGEVRTGKDRSFRHTAVYEQTKEVVSFARAVEVSFAGRALWPCPGVGVIRRSEPGEVTHA